MLTRTLLRAVLLAILVTTALVPLSSALRTDAKLVMHSQPAVDAEADARKAFDDWRAATAKAEKARSDLEAAQKALARARAEALRDKKLTDDEAALLKNLENKVAEAQAAVKAADDELLKARVALEKAIAELPEGNKVKEELKKKRDILTSQEQQNLRANNGLRVSAFHSLNGRVTLNLPEDMRPGETISGTVLAEPAGQNDEERAKNRRELQGMVIEISDFSIPNKPVILRPLVSGAEVIKVPVDAGRFTLSLPKSTAQLPASQVKLRFALSGPSGENVTPPWIEIKDFSFGTDNRPNNGGSNGTGAGKPSWGDFKIPKVVQQGRVIPIQGNFDGDASNTKASLKPDGPGNASGELRPLAESPRQAVFEAPTDLPAGAINITVSDGPNVTEGKFRNVGINLTAPKTTLLRGEKTTLTITVTGLQGITQPTPLTLTSEGVITMDGGMYQPLVIIPSQVAGDGRYTTTRGITGIQAGGWTATATVVVHAFDSCLHDDGNGNSLMFDPVTADYIFLPPPGGTNSVVLPWIAQTRGGGAATPDDNSQPTLSQDGCTLTLEHKTADRLVVIRFDSCTQAGSASATAGKTKFTITDRNISDNVCAAKLVARCSDQLGSKLRPCRPAGRPWQSAG